MTPDPSEQQNYFELSTYPHKQTFLFQSNNLHRLFTRIPQEFHIRFLRQKNFKSFQSFLRLIIYIMSTLERFRGLRHRPAQAPRPTLRNLKKIPTSQFFKKPFLTYSPFLRPLIIRVMSTLRARAPPRKEAELYTTCHFSTKFSSYGGSRSI